MFKSGDSGGDFHQLMAFSAKKCVQRLEVCVLGHCLASDGDRLGRQCARMEAVSSEEC